MIMLRATLESVQHDLREEQSDYGKLEMQLALLEWRLVADQSASPQQITNSANNQFDEFRQSLQQKLDQYKEELSKEFEEFKQDHQAQWQQIHKDNIMSEVQNLLETRICSHGVAHNAQLSQTRLDLKVALSTKVEQRLLELRTESEEGLNRMQKDMDDAIERLEMQLEDLGSKFGSIPLRPASELPFDGDSTHGDYVLSLATPRHKPKSESPEVCQHHGGNLFPGPMVHIVTPPILSSAAPSSIPFVGQSGGSETLGNFAPLPSPDLSYLPSFGSLPHQSPLDPLPATPPLRPLGFGGLSGSGILVGLGVPGGQGAPGVHKVRLMLRVSTEQLLPHQILFLR